MATNIVLYALKACPRTLKRALYDDSKTPSLFALERDDRIHMKRMPCRLCLSKSRNEDRALHFEARKLRFSPRTAFDDALEIAKPRQSFSATQSC